MSKVKVIAAFRLTNGAYLGYHRHIHSALTEAGAEALGLSELIGPYAAAIGEMENVINRPRAFQESRLIAQLDKSRDSYWKAIYRCLAHLSNMSANDLLYPSALTAFTALKQFKGIQQHEYSRESEEIKAALRVAAEPKVKEALARPLSDPSTVKPFIHGAFACRARSASSSRSAPGRRTAYASRNLRSRSSSSKAISTS